MRLLVDLGGTNCRCALYLDTQTEVGKRNYENADFSNLNEILREFLKGQVNTPSDLAISVAAPVVGDEVSMTNIPWSFSKQALSEEFNIPNVHLVNDFTAVAMCLPSLDDDDLVTVWPGSEIDKDMAMAVLGPGTGLGVSGLVACDSGWVPLTGEGGHASAAPLNAEQSRVIEKMRARYGHVSSERLVSGQGLLDIYRSLEEIYEQPRANHITTPGDVSVAAIDKKEVVAREALDLFYGFLANAASNLALTLGARNGVFLAGGILPKLQNDFLKSKFNEVFWEKGRYHEYLKSIPVKLITHEKPAFLGLNNLLDGLIRLP